MHFPARRAALALIVAACAASPVFAQQTTENAPVPPAISDRLQRLEDRLNTLDQHYQEELKKRDAEIAALRSQLQSATAAAQSGAGSTPPVVAQDDATRRQSALDAAVAGLSTPAPAGGNVSAVAQPAATDRRGLASLPVGPATLRLMDISLDVLIAAGGSTANDAALANLQGGGHDPRKNGFTVQNVELSLAGAIDPYLNGEAHIIYLIDPVTGETGVELEEAFLTTQQLPYNLQLKAGQYFTEFGRLNPRHPHQWEFMDQPIINTRLFGPDGMRGTGARLSWLAPLPWYSEFYVGMQNANGETMTSFLANDEFFEERPIGGRPYTESTGSAFSDLVYSARWENGFDLNKEWNAAVGVSGLFGPNASGQSSQTYIYGTDVTIKWRPENSVRGFPYFVWTTEVMGRSYEAAAFDDGETSLAAASLGDWGFYTQGVWGFTPGWRTGLRLEYATGSGESVGGRNNDPFRDNRYRVSPLLEWLPSEFSRVRFQVNYDRAEHLVDKDAFTFWVGFEYLMGAHTAHKY